MSTKLTFNSKIGKRITKLNKDLGKSILKEAIIKFTSTPNGLYIQLKTPFGIISFYDNDAEIITDGQAQLLFSDVIDTISDDEFNFMADDNFIYFNNIPLFGDDLNASEDIQVIGNTIAFKHSEFDKIIKSLNKNKKELKKSIFEESTEFLVEIDHDHLSIIGINPFYQFKDSWAIENIDQKSYFYSNKQNIKILLTLFKSDDDVSIVFGNHILIKQGDLSYILENKELNYELYHPEFKI